MKRLIAVAFAALVLTGCSQDVIIHGESGAVNVGVVTAEQARVSVTGVVEKKKFPLGAYPIAEVANVFSIVWSADQTAFLERDMELRLETVVTYIGTKGSTNLTVDRTSITCPKGFMFSTCVSQLEATQIGLAAMYKEKFSYLK